MRLLAGMMIMAAAFAWPRGAPAQASDKEPPPPPKIEFAGEAKTGGKRTGIVIMKASGEWDKVADEAGQIYVNRGYKGVVPGVRDEPAVPAKKRDSSPDRPLIEWIGFQPFATYSRVFIQVAGDFTFTVTKPRSDRIDVHIPSAAISTSNDERYLDTRLFPTSVSKIFVKQEHESGAVINIYLKKPVGYLFRREGKYIFVDVGM